MAKNTVERVAGRACVLRGDDIDTDRIIPARFLRCVTFDGLGEHAFEDDIEQTKGDHPFEAKRYADANVLVVGQNFGCGSSREHAPQALMRRGFQAFVGGSFAEIFFGNCVSLGLPCLRVSAADADRLQSAVEADPALNVTCDIEAQQIRFGDTTIEAEVPPGTRQQFLDGSWDAMGQLLDSPGDIDATAAQLPYINGFGKETT